MRKGKEVRKPDLKYERTGKNMFIYLETLSVFPKPSISIQNISLFYGTSGGLTAEA